MARRKFPWFTLAGAGALIAAGVALLRRDSSGSSSGCSEDDFRARVVNAALAEVGKKDLPKYLADAAPDYGPNEKPEWCGIFALWALHQAGLAPKKTWKVGYGFLEVPPRLPNTSDPKPGDIVYFTKYSHHAIVQKNNGDGTLVTINGNGQGGVVSIGHPNISDAKAIYSISKLIEDAQKECT